MSDNDRRDQPLEVRIEDGLLSISIGVDTLRLVVESNPSYDGRDGESRVTVSDVNTFARGVLAALQDESEDGTTLVHIMLDEAVDNAIENGAEGVELREEPA